MRLAFLTAATFSALIFLWLAAIIWSSSRVALYNARGFGIGSLLVLGHMAFTLALQRILRHSARLGRTGSYRLAFLTSTALGAILWAYQGLARPGSTLLWELGCTLLGAFAGGLAGTTIDMGLYEKSFEPLPRIAAEVRQHHLQLIGEPPRGLRSKRLFDLALATVGLAIFAPVWILSSVLIWFEDPGPIFFVKNSVGKGGTTFQQIKFRSMICNAEAETGPVPASEEDQRALAVGHLLRKTAMDELPQLLNILRGEMSFVGPRPLRTVVIHGWLKDLPQFAERHAVQPGIAGLSQVRGGYYITPRQRLRFDRIYVQHMSLRFDFKLLLDAALIVFWLRWSKGSKRRTKRDWVD